MARDYRDRRSGRERTVHFLQCHKSGRSSSFLEAVVHSNGAGGLSGGPKPTERRQARANGAFAMFNALKMVPGGGLEPPRPFKVCGF